MTDHFRIDMIAASLGISFGYCHAPAHRLCKARTGKSRDGWPHRRRELDADFQRLVDRARPAPPRPYTDRDAELLAAAEHLEDALRTRRMSVDHALRGLTALRECDPVEIARSVRTEANRLLTDASDG